MPAAQERPAPGRRPATAVEARALASPLRLRIIRELFDGPLTNTQIAGRVGRDKASVLHHVRVLVDAGFVEALPPRPGPRGSRERPYRSTGKSWRLDVANQAGQSGGDGPSVEDAMLQAFVEEMAAAPARPILTRLALRLSAPDSEELAARLTALLDEFADRPPDPEGEALALFLTLYRRADHPPA